MPVRSLIATLACLGFACLTPTTVHADPPDSSGLPAAEVSEGEAEKLVKRGQAEMVASNDDASRSVEAALDFLKALSYYEKIGNIDKVSDLKANIFWCKKRMDHDTLTTFLKRQHGDTSTVEQALKTVDAIATKEVPKEEAGAYFSRAEKYAKDHPGDYEQIATNYFEVASRFVGTELAIKAQKESLAAQEAQTKVLKAERERERDTLFTKPFQGGDGHKAKVPTPEDELQGKAQVKSLYKAEFTQTKLSKKRRLAAKLLAQEPSAKEDPTTQYVLLVDAIELAGQSGDWYTVMHACDLLSQDFEGIDAKAKKKEVFGKFHGSAVVQSILKLLDSPEDPAANSIVGKYFWHECGMTDIGLKLLAHGDDADLKSAAEMEVLKPEGTQQQIQLADKWYALGKKARPPARDPILGRAFAWYKIALANAQGVTKEKLKQRIDEIDNLLPMTNLNYAELTPRQWDRLKGEVIEVVAGRDRSETGVILSQGVRLRVVPNPTDTWNVDGWDGPVERNWKGERPGGEHEHDWGDRNDIRTGAVIMFVEQGPPKKPGIIEGEGRLFVGPYSNGFGASGSGVIRCKIIAVGEDE